MNTLTLPLVAAVALGGAIGSVARYVIGAVLARPAGAFPLATLLINVVGSLLIGVFARLFEAPDTNPVLRAALIVGLCGGFTTFSTFSAETIALLQEGRAARAAAYVTVSIVAGVLATFVGLLVGRTAR